MRDHIISHLLNNRLETVGWMVVMYLLLREGSMYGLARGDCPSMDDWERLEISQQRTSVETTYRVTVFTKH